MNNINLSRGNLLLEFFSEEIPARMQLNSERQLENLFTKSLTKRNMAFESFKTYFRFTLPKSSGSLQNRFIRLFAVLVRQVEAKHSISGVHTKIDERLGLFDVVSLFA